MVEEKVSPRTMRVVDRRRFTTEGEPRQDVPNKTGSTPEKGPSLDTDASQKVASAPVPTQAPESSPDRENPPTPSPNNAVVTSPEFVELIASLAQQAEMLLVGAEGLPAEPDHARRIIDYVAVLESKTAGNVSPEEQQMLSNVVFQLRSLYLQGQ
ncbi:MAG: DUF1844 domain-containing protein [Acidobacteriota bacterium]|nr:DUF1844 domain-containing protein [Acidobacteriota bacterium]